MRSRFEWGLTADVQAPDLETRMAILREKADREDIIIPNDVILFIASAIETNIREIEGAFTRVSAYASFNGGTINLEQAKKALSELNNENNNQIINNSNDDYSTVTNDNLDSADTDDNDSVG